MSHLVKLAQSFSKDESGAALVEYAVIFAVLLAGTITAFTAISTELGNVFAAIQGILAGVAGLLP